MAINKFVSVGWIFDWFVSRLGFLCDFFALTLKSEQTVNHSADNPNPIPWKTIFYTQKIKIRRKKRKKKNVYKKKETYYYEDHRCSNIDILRVNYKNCILCCFLFFLMKNLPCPPHPSNNRRRNQIKTTILEVEMLMLCATERKFIPIIIIMIII